SPDSPGHGFGCASGALVSPKTHFLFRIRPFPCACNPISILCLPGFGCESGICRYLPCNHTGRGSTGPQPVHFNPTTTHWRVPNPLKIALEITPNLEPLFGTRDENLRLM